MSRVGERNERLVENNEELEEQIEEVGGQNEQLTLEMAELRHQVREQNERFRLEICRVKSGWKTAEGRDWSGCRAEWAAGWRKRPVAGRDGGVKGRVLELREQNNQMRVEVAELGQVREWNDQLVAQNDQLQVEVAELGQVREQNDHLVAQNEVEVAELGQVRERNDQLVAQNDQLQVEVDQVRERNDQLQEELGQVREICECDFSPGIHTIDNNLNGPFCARVARFPLFLFPLVSPFFYELFSRRRLALQSIE